MTAKGKEEEEEEEKEKEEEKQDDSAVDLPIFSAFFPPVTTATTTATTMSACEMSKSLPRRKETRPPAFLNPRLIFATKYYLTPAYINMYTQKI
jgi:hypothetical protein